MGSSEVFVVEFNAGQNGQRYRVHQALLAACLTKCRDIFLFFYFVLYQNDCLGDGKRSIVNRVTLRGHKHQSSFLLLETSRSSALKFKSVNRTRKYYVFIFTLLFVFFFSFLVFARKKKKKKKKKKKS